MPYILPLVTYGWDESTDRLTVESNPKQFFSFKCVIPHLIFRTSHAPYTHSPDTVSMLDHHRFYHYAHKNGAADDDLKTLRELSAKCKVRISMSQANLCTWRANSFYGRFSCHFQETEPNQTAKKNGQWKNRVFCKSNKLKTKFKPEMQNNMRNSVARTVETLNKTAHFFSLHRFQIMALIVWHVPFCWAQTIQLRIRHNAIVCIGRHCTVHTINCIANCGLCFWLIECYCQCWHVI